VLAELIREAALEGVRDESPYSLAVVIDDAILYVERDRPKGIVIGKGGARLREVGTAARTQIEKL
jgi:GTPase